MSIAESQDGGQPQYSGAGWTGILPCQAISALWRDGEITATQPLADGQIQPSSLDLRLGEVAYRVRASFLPGPGQNMAQKIDRYTMHSVDLTKGAVLERGCVYIVPLLERLSLSQRLSAIANPKSSTGRLDVFTRLITDGADPSADGCAAKPNATSPGQTPAYGPGIDPPASTITLGS